MNLLKTFQSASRTSEADIRTIRKYFDNKGEGLESH